MDRRLLHHFAFCVLAVRPRPSVAVRSLAWLAALATLGWIVSLAITKDPLGFLGMLRLPRG